MNIDNQLSASDLNRILVKPEGSQRSPRLDADKSDTAAVKVADEAENIAEMEKRSAIRPQPRIEILKWIDIDPIPKR